VRRAVTALGLAAAGGIAYSSLVERNLFGLRREVVPCLPPGARPLRLLHLSDPHLVARQQRKRSFISALAELEPDLVVHTGDTLGGADGVDAVAECFGPLLAFPGVFCLGSNDYYGPAPKNPLKYFKKNHKRVHGTELDWERMTASWVAGGWTDLTNTRATVELRDGRRVAARGVDDPHIKRDRMDAVSGPWEEDADLRLGLVHAPEPRLLDVFAGDGAQLLLCGHTHGGQLRVPWFGALVTNCGLDRGRAMGVSPYGKAWLHVSPGLGTSVYAPVRFACPPRASLLTLTPASAPAGVP